MTAIYSTSMQAYLTSNPCGILDEGSSECTIRKDIVCRTHTALKIQEKHFASANTLAFSYVYTSQSCGIFILAGHTKILDS